MSRKSGGSNDVSKLERLRENYFAVFFRNLSEFANSLPFIETVSIILSQ